MSRLLPPNYHGEKYGLKYRLVEEKDASFIVEVRNNPKVGSFLHSTSSDIEDQKEWIRKYKEREENGLDYYFIFFKNDIPVGLNRIYSIHDKTYTGGSWAMVPNLPFEIVLAVPLIKKEIAFEELGFEIEDNYDGVHVDNKKVIKFNKLFGSKIYRRYKSESGEFFSMLLRKEDFEANKPRLVKLLNIDNNE